MVMIVFLSLCRMFLSQKWKLFPVWKWKKRYVNYLSAVDYTEIVNYSFGIPGAADILNLPENDERRNMVRIRNPLGEDLSAMRTTMIYGLLEAAKRNANNGSFDLKIFEMGRVFIKQEEGKLPEEKNILAGLITGKLTDEFWHADKTVDFYVLKGCVENIFHDLKINNCKYISSIY